MSHLKARASHRDSLSKQSSFKMLKHSNGTNHKSNELVKHYIKNHNFNLAASSLKVPVT